MHRLEEVLVHRERRAEHARADVGDARELEQPLHRPVLAEGPVQDREDDVDVRRASPAPSTVGTGSVSARPSRPSAACPELPAAVAADLDR